MLRSKKIYCCVIKLNYSGFSFFQNEGILVQLDELDKLDKVTHAAPVHISHCLYLDIVITVTLLQSVEPRSTYLNVVNRIFIS